MALIEISNELLEDEEVLPCIKYHFNGIQEIKYLAKGDTRTYYVVSKNFRHSEQISPTIEMIDGKLCITAEN